MIQAEHALKTEKKKQKELTRGEKEEKEFQRTKRGRKELDLNFRRTTMHKGRDAEKKRENEHLNRGRFSVIGEKARVKRKSTGTFQFSFPGGGPVKKEKHMKNGCFLLGLGGKAGGEKGAPRSQRGGSERKKVTRGGRDREHPSFAHQRQNTLMRPKPGG